MIPEKNYVLLNEDDEETSADDGDGDEDKDN